jgi:hypothetical protein
MPVDLTFLAAAALPYLVQYLPAMTEAGKFVGGKALEKVVENTTDEILKFARPWLGRLMGKIESTPTALKAAQRVAAAPENKDLQTALKVELTDILGENPDLAEEISRILDQAKADGKQIAADRGGVAFGDNAQENIAITGGVGGDFIKGDKRES